MKMQGIFGRRPARKVQRHRLESGRPLGGVIKCRKCKTTGRIEVYFPGDYWITPGWRIVWNWIWPVYICPRCADEMISSTLEALNIRKN